MADRGRRNKGPLPPLPESSILGDLESIRSLLALDAHDQSTEEDPADVPLLDDVVDGALEVDESPLESRRGFAAESQGESALGDDTIKLLLGDHWRSAAEDIIDSARKAMSAAGAHWSPQESEALAKVLHDRIDSTLGTWMRQIAVDNLSELRERLLVALREEVATIADQLIDTTPPPDATKRGK